MADAGSTASNQHVASVAMEAVDTGLGCLGLVLALSGEAFDFDRARREYLIDGRTADCDDLVRIARAQGLKARVSRSSVKRVKALSLPVIARGRDGTFFVIGRLIETGVLIGHAGGPPVAWTLEQLEREWTGEVVLVVKRDRLPGEVARFGLRWSPPDGVFRWIGRPSILPVGNFSRS
jgi:subfamily B ATP-binding cassette protein HlyB/CyaB